MIYAVVVATVLVVMATYRNGHDCARLFPATVEGFSGLPLPLVLDAEGGERARFFSEAGPTR
jgi:hypothetical protein